jgi:hypothetical protein
MEGFGCNVPDCPSCAAGGQSAAPPEAISPDLAARMVAVVCASILAAAAGEKDHTKVLATSDIYLDFIRPRTLHVSKEGEVHFGPQTGGDGD